MTLLVIDAAFGARMDSMFVDDLHYSKAITAASFGQRSWLERVTEGGASLITRLP